MSKQDSIKFLHFRKRGANGEIESRGGMTIAYVDDATVGARFFAIAQCSTQDNFCKARGRELAVNRLSSPVFARVTVADDNSFLDDSYAVAASLGYERKFSGKRKRATSPKAGVASRLGQE